MRECSLCLPLVVLSCSSAVEVDRVNPDAQLVLIWRTNGGVQMERIQPSRTIGLDAFIEGTDAFVIQIRGDDGALSIPIGPLPESHPHGLPIFQEALVYQRLPAGAGPVEEVGWEELPEEARMYLYPASGCPTGLVEEVTFLEGRPRFALPWMSGWLLGTSRSLTYVDEEEGLHDVSPDLPEGTELEQGIVEPEGDLLLSLLGLNDGLVRVVRGTLPTEQVRLGQTEYESFLDEGRFVSADSKVTFFFGRRGVRERVGQVWNAVGDSFGGSVLGPPPRSVVASGGSTWVLFGLQGGVVHRWSDGEFEEARVGDVELRTLQTSSDRSRVWAVDSEGRVYEGPPWRPLDLVSGRDGSKVAKGSDIPYLISSAGVAVLVGERVCSIEEEFGLGELVVAKSKDAILVATGGVAGTFLIRVGLLH